ncbi:MAG: hypothetical protein AB1631_23305 [Acidobacteriota bacterium]
MTIQRRGSFLYARAWRTRVLLLALACAGAGAGAALVVHNRFDSLIATLIIGSLTLAFVCSILAAYRVTVWVFSREARQSVEITNEGIRETRDGRERSFIPWAGVREIEVASTFPAGANIRIKSDFSEIAFSNVDLVVTPEMNLRQMHASLGETRPLGELLDGLRARAPQAEVSRKGLARRLKKSESDDAL